MTSLKKNIILSYINTLTGIIFPIVTFPYATRVLLPEGIGIVDFNFSIINYIVLFTSLGIPTYAVREIAKYRDSIELRNQKTVEIALLNLILCFIGYIAVGLIGSFVPKVNAHLELFYVLSLAIFFTAIGVYWFYQAIEDFKFITLRGIIIRTVCAISLFVFVKDKDDLLIYGLIMVGATVGNNLLNFIHLRKFIRLSTIRIRQLNVWQHFRPAAKMFLMFAFVSIYIYLNNVILGFLQGDRAVGLYTSGMRISHIINTVVTSLGAVMLPRCSNLIETGKETEFNSLITKSYHFVLAVALPLSAALICFARPMTLLLCGCHFTDAIAVVMITAPTVLIVSISDVVGMQILLPKNKETIIICSTAVAATVNVALNFLLIPHLAEMGAAIGTLVAELSILVVEIVWGRKYIPFHFFGKSVTNIMIGTAVMILGIIPVLFIDNILLELALGIIIGTLFYLGFLTYRQEPVAMMIWSFVKLKVSKS
jgi:O-antigen/teichoic acid export membrane protein